MIVEITGNHACFTRPELKMERVSYDFITPASARSIIQSIYWKPEIAIVIDKIEIINPIQRQAIFRNEISSMQSARMAPIIVDTKTQRQQRMSVVLTDVKYRIHFHISLTDKEQESPTNNLGKHYEIMTRRLEKGQQYSQPYLGLREFVTNEVRLITNIADEPPAANINNDCGYMFYDFDYNKSHRNTPIYYHAVINNGVVDLTTAYKTK